MSLFLEKGFGMYSNSHPARYLSAPTLRGQYVPASYGDFGDYHHHQLAEFGDLLGSPPAAAWSVAHAAPREEWSTFGLPGSSPGAGGGGASHYETTEWTALHPAFGGGSCPSLTGGPGDRSPYSLTSKCAWTRDCAHPASGDVAEHHSVPTAEDPHLSGARTRTKDKYRVVYSDHQRLELEKEFQHNRYINVGKKSQLSLELRLSERQVKIWFQNRRAKERKLMRRKATAAPPSPGAARSDPSPISPPAPPVDC